MRLTNEQGRTFWLIREDTLVAADGVQFPDGTAVIRWRKTPTLKATTAIHDDVGSIVAVHRRSGVHARWCDADPRDEGRVAIEEEDTEQELGFA
jgi:hypothetical protein